MTDLKLPLERWGVHAFIDDGVAKLGLRKQLTGYCEGYDVAALERAYDELQEAKAKAEKERDAALALAEKYRNRPSTLAKVDKVIEHLRQKFLKGKSNG